MKYKHCKKEELIKFAEDRKLVVTASAPRSKGVPSYHDYRNALLQADDSQGFPEFLRLPPEARNSVYDELLTLKDSYTCHPQILATSTQVNSEATGLLFKNNLIEIRIHADGVYAHGIRCGGFSATDHIEMLALEWPAFLRRVEWLKVYIDPVSLHAPTRLCHSNLNKVLYSLCSFLEQDNKLKSFEHTSPQLGKVRMLSSADLRQAYMDFFYPLHMLRGLARLVIAGAAEDLISHLKVTARVEEQQHAHFAAWRPTLLKAEQLRRVVAFVDSDVGSRKYSRLRELLTISDREIQRFLTSQNLINRSWEVLFERSIRMTEKMLRAVDVKELRDGFADRKAEAEKLLLDLETGRGT